MSNVDTLALEAMAQGRVFVVEAVKARRLLVEECVVLVCEHHSNLLGDLGVVIGGGGGGIGGGGSHLYIKA